MSLQEPTATTTALPPRQCERRTGPCEACESEGAACRKCPAAPAGQRQEPDSADVDLEWGGSANDSHEVSRR